MKLRKTHVLATALAAIGIWQLGCGAYIQAKAWLAQELIRSAWSRTLAGETHVRPWPWADTWPVARLQVPEAGVNLYVLSDATGRSLAFGPGHVGATAAPGSSGHSMIAGHRDTHFRFLSHTKRGTKILLETSDGRKHAYTIVETHVFDERDERLLVTSDKATLTLLTCYPFDAVVPGGPLRYAAVAEADPVPFMAARTQRTR
ncbi:MAG TPA: class GN sortase [Steroidobacteraceae bacterium]|jgi:sortase A